MAEGKKQRKFGRNGRNNSSKLQVARTAANKARNARRAVMLAKASKSMWVPRGAARALRRALKFWGKLHSEKIGSVTSLYADSVIGAANTQKLESLYD